LLERTPRWGEDAVMRDAILETLRRLPHFAGLDDETLERLTDASRLLRPEPGSLIVHEGEPCRAFFAVRKGAVRVFRVAPDGKVQVLHRLGPGHSFAEAAVLNMGSYPASAEAVEDGTEVVEIGAATFLALFETDRRMPRVMISSLCKFLRVLLGRVEELSVLSAGARLARYLLDLPARDVERGLEIDLPTSKREIAERLGITPETLSRQLRRWHDQEVIVSERGRVVLLKPDTLLSIAAES
jgi:CRP/FNR family transcriptional regulator